METYLLIVPRCNDSLQSLAPSQCLSMFPHQEKTPQRATGILISLMVVGLFVSLAITLTLAGKLQPVQVPQVYKATYGGE